MKHLIPAFLAFLTLQAGAQNVKLNSGGDWKVPVKDGVLELKGRMRKITSEQLQKVDPAARYTLTWEARGNVPEEAGKYMIGFSVYDKDGQEIQPYHVYYTPGSETVLTEDAPKGGRTLKIRDGSKWKSGAMYCPAFHVKADGGDIPNRDVLTGGIEKVTAGDGYTELTLKRPLAKDYPAGTAGPPAPLPEFPVSESGGYSGGVEKRERRFERYFERCCPVWTMVAGDGILPGHDHREYREQECGCGNEREKY